MNIFKLFFLIEKLINFKYDKDKFILIKYFINCPYKSDCINYNFIIII